MYTPFKSQDNWFPIPARFDQFNGRSLLPQSRDSPRKITALPWGPTVERPSQSVCVASCGSFSTSKQLHFSPKGQHGTRGSLAILSSYIPFRHLCPLVQYPLSAMYECYRCQRSFAARHSLEQHKRNSPYHHECHYCSNDYVDRDDWEDHMEDMHGHCWYCDEGFNYRTQHLIDQHNMCEQCGQCFGSPNSVRQVGTSRQAGGQAGRQRVTQCHATLVTRPI